MPKYRPETEKAKAKILTKAYVESRLNQSALARKVGVKRASINQRLNRPIVQKTLAEYLDKHFTKNYIKTKFKDGLEADKVVGYLNNKVDGVEKISDEFVEVPDLHCRHKYLVTLLECQGHLKTNGKNGGVSIVNINYGYRNKPLEVESKNERA